MQNNNYDELDKTSEEGTQTSSKKNCLSKGSQAAVTAVMGLNTLNGDSNNSELQISAFANCAKSLVNTGNNTKISHDTLKSKFVSAQKSRKNLRAKKRKKTQEEINILEAYFTQDPAWTRKTVKSLKGELPNLSVDQIYKWGYDKKLLQKKYRAQEKAKKSTVSIPQIKEEPDVTLQEVKISDFNLEVDELCKFESTSTQDSTEETPATPVTAAASRSAPPTRRGSHLGSSKDSASLPTAVNDDFEVVEDDPFFYERKDEAVFYVVINGSSRGIPQRRPGKRGLFRVPSGFANMDFYTYKEEAFQKEGDHAFLGELYKQD